MDSFWWDTNGSLLIIDYTSNVNRTILWNSGKEKDRAVRVNKRKAC
jgi:hypothetical protein